MLQRAPQTPRLDPHDGVEVGVEVLAAAEHLRRNGVALQPMPPAGQGLLDHEAEEVPQPNGRLEIAVSEEALELRPHLLGRGLPGCLGGRGRADPASGHGQVL